MRPKPELAMKVIMQTRIYKSELGSGVGRAEVGLGLGIQSINTHYKLNK